MRTIFQEKYYTYSTVHDEERGFNLFIDRDFNHFIDAISIHLRTQPMIFLSKKYSLIPSPNHTVTWM